MDPVKDLILFLKRQTINKHGHYLLLRVIYDEYAVLTLQNNVIKHTHIATHWAPYITLHRYLRNTCNKKKLLMIKQQNKTET